MPTLYDPGLDVRETSEALHRLAHANHNFEYPQDMYWGCCSLPPACDRYVKYSINSRVATELIHFALFMTKAIMSWDHETRFPRPTSCSMRRH